MLRANLKRHKIGSDQYVSRMKAFGLGIVFSGGLTFWNVTGHDLNAIGVLFYFAAIAIGVAADMTSGTGS